MRPDELDREELLELDPERGAIRFAGQRALLLRSPGGNVLWDCISLIDDATIDVLPVPPLPVTRTNRRSSTPRRVGEESPTLAGPAQE